MTNSSTAKVNTEKASSYLQQLCKHFAHKTKSEHTPQAGWIEFSFGRAEMRANGDCLDLTASALNNGDLAKLQHVLGSHLERFAFREELNIIWDN